MDTCKMKIKLGDHEFEAEGPVEVVERQFAAFKELIANMPVRPVAPTGQSQPATTPNSAPVLTNPEGKSKSGTYDTIMKAEGRVVSLTAMPANAEDAILLVMIGQKIFRNNDAVTGGEIRDGLEQSGIAPGRTDRTMESFVSDGLIMKIGKGKATRYRLTNQGFTKADEIAGKLIQALP